MKALKLATVALLGVVALSGCTQVSRQIGSLTDNKYSEARSGTVWVVPPPQLEPPSSQDMNVYVSYRNISDVDLDLLDLLKDSAREQGWKIVNDPNQAAYRLRATTRFFGEVEPESGGAGVGATMGGIAGAAVGVGVGIATANAFNSHGAGWAAGGVVGGLMAAGLANSSRPREWALIVDVVLEQKQDQEVEFEMTTGSSTASTSMAGTGNARTVQGGSTTAGNTSNATVTRKSNYFPHGIRLSVWANQMNMTQEEAMPEIIDRTRRVVTRMLPM